VCIDDFAGPELMEKEKLKSEAAEELHRLWAAEKRGEDAAALLRSLKRKFGVTAEQAAQLKQKYYGPRSGGPAYRFEAMKKGLAAASRVLEPVHSVSLRVLPERTELREEGMWDALEVRLLAEDQNGNRLPYASDALTLETEGPIGIIGPACVPLRGGAAGVWIRSLGEKGESLLRIRGFGPDRELRITVE
jgi:beta-galactosidase